MTDDLPLPAPGWYDDPEAAGGMRYWTGTAWGERWHRGGAGQQVEPVGRGFLRLAVGIRLGLGLSVLALGCRIALSIWGLQMVDHAVAVGDIDRLNAYDDLARIVLILEAVALPVTGVLWMIWQYRLALATAPQQGLRSPGMHAGSWVIPVGSFWLPLQNIRALFVAWRGGDPVVVAWWWIAWILYQISIRVVTTMSSSADNVSALKNVMATWIVTGGLGLVAALAARRVVRDLTVAAGDRARQESVTPEASPAD